MISEIRKCVTLILTILIFTLPVFSQKHKKEESDKVTLQKGLQILEKYFMQRNNWYVTSPEIGKNVKGLIHFIEDEPVDSIITKLNKASSDSSFIYVFRLPENVPDSLHVPGYFPATNVERDIEKIGLTLQNEYQKKELSVPMELLTNIEDKVKLLEPGEGIVLFTDSIYTFPDSLKLLDAIPDTMIQNDADFQRILHLDSLRNEYVNKKRLAFNDSIINAYRDSVITEYRQEKFEEEYNFRKLRFVDSVRVNNYQVLKNYNDSIVRSVNDSISFVIKTLSDFADFIDTTRLTLSNLTDDETEITLQNKNERYTRIWLKNEQKDSLSVLVKSTDKNSIKMLIDDGVTFSRFTPKQTKDFDFSTLNKKVSGLNGVGKKYEVETPWRLGGDGTVGFTQTYLENWKKGGQSALSLLIVLKGSANYSRADGKVKWENSGEIRNGWIRPGGEDSELQKNDDRFEITSRFGVSAFKKWYYSAEFNYETQFFRGYKYPTASNPEPISTFMAPAKTFFKVGLDYKPNKDFSLLLSPLTLKNVYVRDTSLIDQTNFGVPADKKGFWEPGLNADIGYKRKLTDDIAYETKYKMFINYKKPFSKFDINWENLVIMKLTDNINMRMMVHLIYDDDILFPVYDQNGDPTGDEKPKLQIKQLITVGFSYTINRNVMRTRRIR
jgi:hypothetical protein